MVGQPPAVPVEFVRFQLKEMEEEAGPSGDAPSGERGGYGTENNEERGHAERSRQPGREPGAGRNRNRGAETGWSGKGRNKMKTGGEKIEGGRGAV